MDLTAVLPWWGGVALAIGSFVLMHALAGMTIDLAAGSKDPVGLMFQAGMRTFAFGLQFVLPIVFSVGAVMSVVQRRKRAALADTAASSASAGVLQDMTWREFEMLVGEAFRQQGYQVVETGGGGADGGVDLVLRRNGEKYLVQCKQWKAFKVGVTVVRELYGVMAAGGAAGGFVVTSGRFTAEAGEFAKGRNLKLLDGPALHALLKTVREARSGANQPLTEPESQVDQTEASATPVCPLCRKAMVPRTAKRGMNAGERFWGCSDYPGCRGTRKLG